MDRYKVIFMDKIDEIVAWTLCDSLKELNELLLHFDTNRYSLVAVENNVGYLGQSEFFQMEENLETGKGETP